MLVISRKQGESIKVADDIEIVVIAVDGGRVRLGVKAPRSIRILRAELDPAVAAASNQAAALKTQAPAEDLAKAAASLKKKREDES